MPLIVVAADVRPVPARERTAGQGARLADDGAGRMVKQPEAEGGAGH